MRGASALVRVSNDNCKTRQEEEGEKERKKEKKQKREPSAPAAEEAERGSAGVFPHTFHRSFHYT